MRNVITIQGGVSISEVEISPGEELEINLTWKNSDGTTRDMSGHTVTFRILTSDEAVLYNGILASTALISIGTAVTSGWAKGWYDAQLWDNDGSGDVAAGSWSLHVYTEPTSTVERFKTVAEVINQVAIEVIAPEATDPMTSGNSDIKLLRTLLVTSCQMLNKMYEWPLLQREHSFITVDGDTGIYDLPHDFGRMIPQTAWQRSNWSPMVSADATTWQYLQARSIGISIWGIFRISQGELWLWPQPPASGIEIAYEYMTRNCFYSPGAPRPDLEQPETSEDRVAFDPLLITRLLKALWLRNKGFDSTAATQDFELVFSSVTGQEKPGAVISLTRRSGFKLIDDLNIPEGNWGV